MSGGRWAGRALRAAGALVVVGAVAGVVAGGMRLAPATGTAADADRSVDVAPPPAVVVCPGPLMMPETTGTGAFDPTPVDAQNRVGVVATVPDGGTLTGAVSALGTGDLLAPLAPGSGTASLDGAAEPVVASADGGGASARLAGTASALVTAGDLRGLAAASCAAPTADAWLLGGSTAVGSTADLVLVNPGATTAEVRLEVWGPTGLVELPAATQLVAPGAQRVVGLGGAAGEQRVLAVHVASSGGRVAAYLQDSALRGFTPAGVELVVPGAAPATRQVVPGVLVEGSTPDSPDAPVLRLLAPGAATAATVTLLGPDGPVELAGTVGVAVPAGQVTDVLLGGLPAGAYTVVVDAGEPVVASVSFSRVGAPGELDSTPRVERAWAAATVPGGGLVAPAPGAGATLVVGAVPVVGASDGSSSAEASGPLTGTLRVLGAGGVLLDAHTVTIDATSTAAWPLSDLTADPAAVTGLLLLPDEGTVAASWALVAEQAQGDGELVSVVLPTPDRLSASTVRVRTDPSLGLG